MSCNSDSVILQFLRAKGAIVQNITAPPRVELQSTPYNSYTKLQLDMRRKIEILKNSNVRSQTNKLTASQKYAAAVNRNTNVRNNIAANIAANPSCLPIELKPTWTTASDIPGPPMILTYDPTVPLYNYVNSTNAYTEVSDILKNPELYILPVSDVANPASFSDPTQVSLYYYFNNPGQSTEVFYSFTTSVSAAVSGSQQVSREFNIEPFSMEPTNGSSVSTSTSNFNNNQPIQTREMDNNVYVYVSNIIVNIYYKDTLIKSSADGGPDSPIVDLSQLNDLIFEGNSIVGEFRITQFLGNITIRNLKLQKIPGVLYNIRLNISYSTRASSYTSSSLTFNTGSIINISPSNINKVSGGVNVISVPDYNAVLPFTTSSIVMTSFTITSIGVNSIQIQLESSGDINRYQIQYTNTVISNDDISTLPVTPIQTTSNSLSYQLTGLNPNTQYYIYISCANEIEQSNRIYRSFLTFSPPTNVTGLYVTDISNTSARVYFNPSSLYLTGYVINLIPSVTGYPKTLTANTSNTILTDLSENISYTFTIYATGTYGNSQVTQTTFTTEKSASPPSQIVMSNVASYNATLSFTAGENAIQSFISSSPHIDGLPAFLNSNTPYSFNNLSILTTYTIYIQSIGTFGNSEVVSTTFTTKSPASIVTNFVVDNITASSARISYSPSVYYVVNYVAALYSGSVYISDIIIPNNVFQYTISNLTEGTPYSISIYASGTYGDSPVITDSFSTQFRASPVTGLSYYNLTNNSVFIKYNASIHNVIGYSFRFNANGINTIYTRPNTILDSSFHNLSPATFYQVFIKALGTYGDSIENNLFFTTKSGATAIDTLILLGLNSTSVNVVYSASQNANGYVIDFSPSIPNTPATVAVNILSRLFTGLVEGVTYTVSVYATGEYGDSPVKSTTFTTPFAASPIQNLRAIDVKAREATIAYDLSIYNVTGYSVSWSPSIPSNPFVLGPDISSNRFTNLSENTAYTVSVYAIGQYGNSAVSNVTFTTFLSAQTPQNISVVDISATIATITYDLPLNDPIGYYINVYNSLGRIVFSNTFTTTRSTITGLSYNSAYTATVMTIGLYGNSSVSSPVSFQTKSPASNITGLAISQLSSTSLTVTYNPSIYDLSYYKIEFLPTISGSPFSSYVLSNDFTGLTANTNYTVYVSAIGVYGNSAISDVSFKTFSPASDISGLVLSNLGAFSVDVSFLPSVNYVTGYNIDITPPVNGLVTPFTITSTNVSLTGLSKLTTYTLSITAIGLYGNSNTSDISFTTFSPAGDLGTLTAINVNITYLDVSFQPTDYTNTYEVSVLPEDISIFTSNILPIRVNGLNAGTLYTITVKPIGNYGNGLSSVTTVTTKTAALPITNLTVDTIRSTTARVLFSPSVSTDISGYYISYSSIYSFNEFITNNTNFTLTDLCYNTFYDLSVTTIGIYANSSAVNTSFLTKQPAADISASITSVTASTVEISYTASQYDLLYYSIDLFNTVTFQTIRYNQSVDLLSHTFTGLDRLTNYIASVQAVGLYGNSNTVDLSFTTFSPATDISLSYSNVLANSVYVFYNPSVYSYSYYITVSPATVGPFTITDTSLNITGLTIATQYTIQVVALGTYGNSATSSVSVITKQPASDITGLVLSNILRTTARLSYDASLYDVSGYQISITDNGLYSLNVINNDISYNITGLEEGVTYSVSIYAIGIYGNSNTSTTSFTTYKSASNIVDASTVNLTATTTDISFSPSVNNVTNYILQIGNTTLTSPISFFSLSSLTSGTLYDISLQAIGVYGNSAITPLQFRTQYIPTSITGLSYEILSISSVRIYFNPALYATYYRITISPDVAGFPTNITDTSCNVDGLLQNISYTVNVTAYNPYGNSNITSITNVIPGPIPSDITGLNVTGVDVSNATVSFNSSTNTNSYSITLTEGPTIIDSSFITSSLSTISYPYRGLTRFTTYTVSVFAIGLYANSNSSSTSFTTQSVASDISLSVLNVTAQTIDISYSESVDPSYITLSRALVTGYSVNITPSGDVMQSFTNPSNIYTYRFDINPGTYYTIHVYAIGLYGNSNVVETTVLSESPASSITGLAISNLTVNTAILSYNISSNTTAYSISIVPLIDGYPTTTTDTSYNVTGLSEGTAYTISVYAIGTYGNSATSTVAFTTYRTASAITGLTTKDISVNIATVVFNQSTDVSGYSITLNPGNIVNIIIAPPSSQSQVFYNYTGLTRFTTYTVSVFAIGLYADSGSSSTSFTTQSVASDISLSILNVTAQTIDISYSESVDPSYITLSRALVTGYSINITPSGDVMQSFTNPSNIYTYRFDINPGTYYTIHVYAIGLYGNSNVVETTVLSDSPASSITGLAISNLTVNSAILSYNISSNTTAYSISIVPSVDGYPTTTTDTSYNIVGLSEGTSYTISVYAIGTYGNSATSTVAFTTYRTASAITGLTTKDVSINIATVGFNQSTDVSGYSLTLNPGNIVNVITAPPSSQSQVFYNYTELTRFTTYTVSVYAIGLYADSGSSSTSFTTQSVASDISLSILNITAQTIDISYSESVDPSYVTLSRALVTGYSVNITPSGGTIVSDINPSNVFTYSFNTNINPGTYYTIHVYAIGLYGNSNVVETTVLSESPASSITGLAISNLTVNTAILSYNISSNTTAYSISIVPLIDGYPTTTTDTSYNVTGLSEGTAYTISVYAIGTYGNSATSTVAFTTYQPATSITGLFTKDISVNIATVGFNQSTDVSGYSLTLNPGNIVNIITAPPSSQSQVFYNYTGLTRFTTYTVSVFAIGLYSNSNSRSTSFTTQSLASDISLSILNITAQTIDISYSESVDPSYITLSRALVTGYSVNITPSGGTIVSDINPSNVFTYRFNTNINPGTYYTIRVYTIGLYGNSNVVETTVLTQSPASSITGLAISNLTVNSAILSYNISSNTTAYSISIVPSVDGYPTTTTDTSYNIVGLSEGTAYTISVYAIGTYGNSATSSVAFTTYRTASAITGLTTKDVSLNIATVVFNQSTDVSGYSLTLNPGNIVNVITAPPSSQTQVFYPYTNLTTNTTYTVSVYAIGLHANSDISQTTFTTKQNASSITGLQYSNLGASTVTISYNESSYDVSGYSIAFTPSITGSPFTTTLLTNNFSGLSNGVSYTVSVYAIGIYGNSDVSTISFTTFNIAAPITGLTYSNLTTTSVDISYNSSAYANSYVISLDSNVLVDISDLSYTITGLTPDTSYNIAVYGVGTYGNSNPSSIDIRTKVVPSNISNVRFDIGPTSMRVIFSPSSNANSYNLSFTLPYVVNGGMNQISGGGNSYDISFVDGSGTFNGWNAIRSPDVSSSTVTSIYNSSNGIPNFPYEMNITGSTTNATITLSQTLNFTQTGNYEFYFYACGKTGEYNNTHVLSIGLTGPSNISIVNGLSMESIGTMIQKQYTFTVTNTGNYLLSIVSNIGSNTTSTIRLTGVYVYNNVSIPPAGLNDLSYVYTGLTASTVYYGSIQAIGTYGNSAVYNYSNTTNSLPQPPTIALTDSSNTSLNISLTTSSSTFDIFNIYYKKSYDSNYLILYANKSTTTYTITGLIPSTTYHIYVTAVDHSVESSSSNILTAFTTGPPYPITSLTLLNRTDTTAYISYTPSTQEPLGTSYDISVNPAISGSGFYNVTDTSFLITGLSGGFYYVIDVNQVNSFGISTDVSLSMTTYMQPTPFTATAYGTYITLNFTVVTNANCGSITANTVYYSKRGSGTYLSKTVFDGSNITDLDPSSVYDLSMIVTFQNTESVPSSNTATTLSIPPDLSSIDLSVNGFTTVTLSVVKPSGIYTGYVIRRYNTNTSTYLTDVSYTDNTSGLSYITFSDLSAATSYIFSGYTYYYDLISNVKQTDVITTYTAPSPVTGLTVLSKTGSTIYISYTPSTTLPLATSYDLSINPAISGSFTNYSDVSYLFQGLNPGYYYTISVYARNGIYMNNTPTQVTSVTWMPAIPLTLTAYGRYIVPTYDVSNTANSGSIMGNTITYTKRSSGTIITYNNHTSGASLTGLDPSSVYDVSLVTQFSNTYSIPSGSTVTTLAVPPTLVSIDVSYIGITSVILKVVKPSGTYTGYTIRTYHNGTYLQDISTNNNTAGTDYVTINNLYKTYTGNVVFYMPFDTNFSNYASGTASNTGITTSSSVPTISSSTYKYGTGSLLLNSANSQRVIFPYTFTNSGISIAFWFNSTSDVASNPVYIFNSSNINILFTKTTGALSLVTSITISSILTNYNNTGWHHYVFTISKGTLSNATVNIYIDGSLKQTVTNTNYLTLGSYTCSIGASRYNGYIDEFYLIEREISQTEVNAIYNNNYASTQFSFNGFTYYNDLSSASTSDITTTLYDKPNPVTSLAVSSKTDTTISVTWSPSTVPTSGTTYDVSINPAIAGSTFTGITDSSYTFTGLSAGYSYIISVYAKNSGYSSTEASLNAVTWLSAPTLSLTATGRTITVSFTPITNANAGSVTGNTIVYSKRGGSSYGPINNISNGYVITGLDPSGIYDVSLTTFYANTQSLTGGNSITTIGLPPTLTSLDISMIDLTSITLSLVKPSGTYTGYTIRTYDVTGASYLTDICNNDNVSGMTYLFVDGLQSGRRYIFTGFTYYLDVSSNPTSDISATTYSAVQPVTSLTVTSTTDVSTSISFTPSSTPPLATSYDVSINPAIAGSSFTGITNTYYTFTGLTQGKNYTISVFAKRIGYSSVATTVNYYTKVSPISFTLTAYGRYVVPTFTATAINDSGAVSGNTISYSKRGSGTTNNITLSSGTSITGLDPSSVYDMSLTVTYANTTSIPSGNTTTTLVIPPAMTSLDLSTNGFTSVILKVTKPTGTFTGYTIRIYNVAGATYLTDVSYVDNTSGIVYNTITGLTADSSYSFYGYMNYYDLSSSTSTSLTTSVMRTYMLPTPVTGLNTVSKTQNSIYISYTPPSLPYTPTYDLSINPAVAGSFTGYTDTSYNFTGLVQATKYIIRIYTKYGGYSSSDASINVYTNVSPIPLTLTPYGRYVVPTFTVNSTINDSGAISGNTISYSKRGSGTTNNITLSSGSSITGLDPSSVYDMSLTVTYANTTSIPSGNTTTTAAIPPALTSLDVSAIDLTSITLSVTKPTGTFTGYTIRTYNVATSSYLTDVCYNDNIVNDISYVTIYGLTIDTSYSFYGYTYYSDLSSSSIQSTPQTIRTYLRPLPVTSLTMVSKTDSTIYIRYTPAVPPVVTSYDIYTGYFYTSFLPSSATVSIISCTDARFIVPTNDSTSGGNYINGKFNVYNYTSTIPSATQKDWLLGLYDGGFTKILYIRVQIISSFAYVYVISAGYVSGNYLSSDASMNSAWALKTNISVVTTSNGNGYGCSFFGYNLFQSNITDTSYNFTGLTAGTNYIIRVFAKSSVYSSLEASLNTVTWVTAPSLSLTATGRTITVSFTPITNANAGSVTGNTIVYSKRQGSTFAPITSGVSTGYTLTGLDPSSVYDLSLTTQYQNTNSIPAYANIATYTSPPALTSLDLSTNGITSVILKVTKPVGTYTGYTIRIYDISNSVYLTDASYVDNTSGIVYKTITGLTADSSYSFYGYMNNYDLSSSISTALTTSVVRTYIFPTPVTDLSIVSKTNTNVYISYTPPSLPYTPTYDLSINPPIAGSFTGYTDTSYNFTGLTQGTYYIIRIYTKYSGFSSVDASVNVYTYVSPIALTLTPYGRYVVPTFTATSINNSGAISGNTILYSKRGSGSTSSISLSSGSSITGLDISSVYDMSLTVTYVNTTSISSGNSTTTLSIPNPPSSIATGTITSNSVTITLGKPTGTLPFTGYTVKTYQGSTFIKDTSSNNNTSSSVNITVSGLSGSTAYTFNAFTYYSDLSSSTSLTTTATTQSLYPSGLDTSGLKIYYNFEGNDNSLNRAGSYLGQYDLSYNATISTTTYKRGTQSLQFNSSSSQYASFSTSFQSTTNGLSFAFWMKSNCTGSAWERIFDFASGASNNMIFFSPHANGIGWIVFLGTTSPAYNNYVNVNINDNVWHHIVWTLTYSTGSTSTWRLYIDNVLNTTLGSQNYPPTGVNRTLNYLGKSNYGDPYYNGFIDEFYVFDRVLTAADVSVLYNV